MHKSIDPTIAIQLDNEFLRTISRSYIQLAKYFGKTTPAWFPPWLEYVLIPTLKFDVYASRQSSSRADFLKMLKRDMALARKELNAAENACDLRKVKNLKLKLIRLETSIGNITRANGKAKPGPHKTSAAPKDLIAAKVFETYTFLNGKEPSPRSPKLAAILVSLLDTLGILRPPIGNPLKGTRAAFERAKSASAKVNDVELRKNDVFPDEIVLARLHTLRSLRQYKMSGRAPWGLPGMNGLIQVYSLQTEI